MEELIIHGGPGSGRYPKGSGELKNQQAWRKLSSSRKAQTMIEKKVAERQKRQEKKKDFTSINAQLSEAKRNMSENYSYEDLQAKVNRLRLEKEYRTLISELNSKIESEGHKFWKDIGKKIAKDTLEDIGTQTAKYILGNGINAVSGKQIYKRKDDNQQKQDKNKNQQKQDKN